MEEEKKKVSEKNYIVLPVKDYKFLMDQRDQLLMNLA